ncbi:hypothetical protein ACLOJK_015018 [Asimina triloba]
MDAGGGATASVADRVGGSLVADEFCSWDAGSLTVRRLPSAAAGSAVGGVVGARARSSTDDDGSWT